MKINIIKGVAICSAVFLCLSGCMETGESRPGEDKEEKTKAEYENFEDVLEDIDWSGNYISAEFGENFKIEASVVSDTVYNNEFGLYNISEVEEVYGEEEKIAADLDSYYGSKVSFITSDMTNPVKQSPNVGYTSRVWWYNSKDKYNSYNFIDTLDVFFPFESKDLDKNIIDEKLDVFLQYFSKYMNFEPKDYRCIEFGEEFYDRIEEFGNKSGNTVIDERIVESREKFYNIRFSPVLDNGVFLEDAGDYVQKKLLDGEKVSPILSYSKENNTVSPYVKVNADIVMDSEYNIKSFEGTNSINIEKEPFKKVSIVSLKDIIKKVYEKNKYNIVTVTDISLYYSGYIGDELNENNMRDIYLAPYWVVTYYVEGNDVQYQYIYLAETGELLFATV